ncbi:MAG: PTS sugar transporter subunit IIA [Gammaproteobacteria bacterium]
MIRIADVLTPERVVFMREVSSKKRALEIISERLAKASSLSQIEVFASLNVRERLGSTGLGGGVAIPHARIASNATTMAIVIRLEEAVDYDAADQQPVDLIFALVVPEEATDEHLELLAQLAEVLSDSRKVANLRAASNEAELLNVLLDTPHTSHAA